MCVEPHVIARLEGVSRAYHTRIVEMRRFWRDYARARYHTISLCSPVRLTKVKLKTHGRDTCTTARVFVGSDTSYKRLEVCAQCGGYILDAPNTVRANQWCPIPQYVLEERTTRRRVYAIAAYMRAYGVTKLRSEKRKSELWQALAQRIAQHVLPSLHESHLENWERKSLKELIYVFQHASMIEVPK